MNDLSLTDERQILLLATALAIGLLFGVERGWHGMQEEEKPHVAGVRTFGLIGLLGGVTGLIARQLEQLVFGFVFAAVAGTLITAYVLAQRRSEDAGITSLIAALLTFTLGALATLGHMVSAAAAAVISTLLLGFKPLLHRLVEKIEETELHATLKLLLITVVLLPVLPDRGFGPGQALNPYEIWWMVVLIALISFSGYFADKMAGTEKGVALTSLFAGLASSTALTLHYARLARREDGDVDLLASGILLATATLFPRILVITAVLNPPLALELFAPLAAMTVVVLAPALMAWRRRERPAGDAALRLENPLELGSALRFGLLLALVMLLARLLGDRFGEAGIVALGAISGLADLNAITLSVGRMTTETLALAPAVAAIIVASISNGIFKTALAWTVGGSVLGWRIVVPVIAAAVAGPAVVWAMGGWPSW